MGDHFDFDINAATIRHTDAQLLDALRRYADTVCGRPFTGEQFNKWRKRPCNAATIITRFGSWRDALKAIGIEDVRARRYPPDEIIAELKRVWRELDRPPGHVEMSRRSRISYGPYRKHWGSMRRCCEMLAKHHCGQLSRAALLRSRRSIHQRAPLPRGRRWTVLQRDRFRCIACGRGPALDKSIILHVDHIRPVSRGGSNDLDNLRTLCFDCNMLDPAFVREVFRMVCRYAGQAVTLRRFAEELHQILQTPIANARVADTIQFLADSLLIYCIPPLEMLQKKQGHPPKLCVCDHFVRDGVLQETLPLDPDSLKGCTEAVSGQAGHVIESVPGYFLKGIPGVELSWFPARSNEPELDFVLTIGTSRIPVEVKFRRGEVGKAALAGIEAFCGKAAYAASFGIVVTQTAEGPVGERAIAVPASTFLLLK